jgi:hypothetical protein
VADNNGVERRPSVAGSQQANAAEMLAELVRLVESSGGLPHKSSAPPGEALSAAPSKTGSDPSVETVPEPDRTDPGFRQPPEITPLHPAVEADPLSRMPGVTLAVDVRPPRASDKSHSNNILPAMGGAGVWALVLVGAGAIGSLFWLEGVEPGPPKAPPFIGAAQGPATAPPPSNSAIATSSDASSTSPRGSAPAAEDKLASPEEPPIDLSAHAPPDAPPLSQDLGTTSVAGAQPSADTAGKPLAAPVNTPPAPEPLAASPSVAAQPPDSKPAPAVSPPPGPAQIATGAASSVASPGLAASASDAPLPPVRPGSKVVTEMGGAAPRSTAKLDSSARLSGKSVAHVVVAKVEANDALPPTEPPRGASASPNKGVKTLKTAQAPAAAQPAPLATSDRPASTGQQPSPNPVAHAWGNMVGMVGALTGLIPFVGH